MKETTFQDFTDEKITKNLIINLGRIKKTDGELDGTIGRIDNSLLKIVNKNREEIMEAYQVGNI